MQPGKKRQGCTQRPDGDGVGREWCKAGKHTLRVYALVRLFRLPTHVKLHTSREPAQGKVEEGECGLLPQPPALAESVSELAPTGSKRRAPICAAPACCSTGAEATRLSFWTRTGMRRPY